MAWKDHFGPFTIQNINFQSLDFWKFYFSPNFILYFSVTSLRCERESDWILVVERENLG
jgi:hypothetical protein